MLGQGPAGGGTPTMGTLGGHFGYSTHVHTLPYMPPLLLAEDRTMMRPLRAAMPQGKLRPAGMCRGMAGGGEGCCVRCVVCPLCRFTTHPPA